MGVLRVGGARLGGAGLGADDRARVLRGGRRVVVAAAVTGNGHDAESDKSRTKGKNGLAVHGLAPHDFLWVEPHTLTTGPPLVTSVLSIWTTIARPLSFAKKSSGARRRPDWCFELAPENGARVQQ